MRRAATMPRLSSCWLLLWCACTAAPSQAEWIAEQQNKMGTRVEVQFWAGDLTRSESDELMKRAMAEFDRIEADMSTYRPDSMLSAVNDRAATMAVPVSSELSALLIDALRLSVLTQGAFDITYASVGQYYDYRARQRPGADVLEAALPGINYRQVDVSADPPAVRFEHAGVRVDLGGIAKGHAVEKVAALLRKAGIEHALVTAGGDTQLLGDRRGAPWIVGVRDPDQPKGLVTRMALADEAISTSGDYERFFIEDDVRYHHILDPSTGESAGAVRSVTVIGPKATLTDGYATSLFVMGPDEGLQLINSIPEYEALIVLPGRSLRFSDGLDPR